ncbi:hypothetical protein L1N85_11705 [Paenibacillus alkaliterrae]|uniref:hypothetical protein n=1 Tax=Paenibacillus alkaliterrae TaxID=320909 RepID=UPI001F2273C5|nr:hypothetical protein [Paenibacillus alkaliterrae]MCF2939101.1 hypothetical protein [Paenibacillus alkaliterrae]
MDDTTAIRLEGVVQKRPNFRLGPLDLSIPSGCITAIVGPNDSGKNSTFRLLLDEPSSGLDPLAWKTMIAIVHRFMDRGDRIVLMTSHIIEEVKRLADFIVFMAQGRVLGMFEKDELFSSWFTLFVSGEGLTAKIAAAMPGQCGVEHAGGTTYRVTTNKESEAEAWCKGEGLQLVSRQALELDEIMGALLLQDRLSIRMNEWKGAKT